MGNRRNIFFGKKVGRMSFQPCLYQKQVQYDTKNEKKWYRVFAAGMAVMVLGWHPVTGSMFFSDGVKAAVVLDEDGAVAVKQLKIKKEAGGTANVKTVDGVVISLKKGKNVRIKKKISLDGVEWYKISFVYKKNTYQGYVKKKKILLPVDKMTQEQKGTVNATSLNVRTGAGTLYSILKYKEDNVMLEQGTEVTVLSEDDSSGDIWYQVSFSYGGKKLKGYVSGKYIRLSGEDASEESGQETGVSEKTTSGEEVSEETGTSGFINLGLTGQSSTEKVLTEAEFEEAMAEQGFPESYKQYLRELHKARPMWSFEAYHTGLDWETVIKKQSKAGRNLVPKSKNIAWKSIEEGAYDWASDSFIIFDGTTWVSASENAIQYYMDPRNFLNETDIYQFELLSYNSTYQNREGVASILNNTPMSGETWYSFTSPDTGMLEQITYTDTFLEAAQLSGVSPYHLASRVRQEVVAGSDSFSNSATGTYSGYEGYYNFYNIGANDSAGGGAVAKGLAWAKKKDDAYLLPWTSQYRSIVGGALYIGKSYINKGQNTLYLEKFNVTPISTYNHQYMTNVEAAYQEGSKICTAYSEMEEVPLVFSIPVYTDMPETACAAPEDEGNPNNWLKKLSIKNYTLTPTFKVSDGPETVYSLIVDNSVKSIQVNAETVSAAASLSGTGKQKLEVGNNIVTVQVTAENGDIRDYTIHVVRTEE